MEDDVLELGYTVDAGGCAAADELLAFDLAEGGGADNFGENQSTDIVEADANVAEEGADAFDVDLVGFLRWVVAVLVEDLVECRA